MWERMEVVWVHGDAKCFLKFLLSSPKIGRPEKGEWDGEVTVKKRKVTMWMGKLIRCKESRTKNTS
jgi:hypothetical protein